MSAPCSIGFLKSVLWTSRKTLLKKNGLYTSFVLRQAQVLAHVCFIVICLWHLSLRNYFPLSICVLGEGAVARRAYVPNEQSWICSLIHTPGSTTQAVRTRNNAKTVWGITDQVTFLALYYAYNPIGSLNVASSLPSLLFPNQFYRSPAIGLKIISSSSCPPSLFGMSLTSLKRSLHGLQLDTIKSTTPLTVSAAGTRYFKVYTHLD